MGVRYIGAEVQRMEDPRLLKGGGCYVDDITKNGMLHVAFVRSDHAHANIKTIDTSIAQELSGVYGVYTYKNLADSYELKRMKQLYPAPVIKQNITQFPIADQEVCYVGEILAVVVAQIFVALPFYMRAAKAGFTSVDQRLEAISSTLGARPWRTFTRVTVPLALPSIVGGVVMAWARAMGEFGATIMFAGNVSGRTQTMPLAILEAMEADVDASIAIAVVLIAVSFAVLISFRVVARLGARSG